MQRAAPKQRKRTKRIRVPATGTRRKLTRKQILAGFAGKTAQRRAQHGRN